MKATTFIGLVFLAVVLPCGGCGTGNEGFAGGAMAGGQVAELRAGYRFDKLEVYAAPRFDKTLASSGDVATDVRGYLLYNALDAAMAANWFDSSLALPDGQVYGGLFGGAEFQDGALEAGWCVGARVAVGDAAEDHTLTWATEYQRPWMSWRDHEDQVVTGPCLQFK